MVVKSSAHYQREYRKRLRQKGLVKKEVWIRPENARELLRIEKLLREGRDPRNLEGEVRMSEKADFWSTAGLYEALSDHELATSGRAKIELIDGVDPSLHIIMSEYGDLPIFLTVSGEQIIAESVLWPASEVTDVAAFNDAVLRTHKYFPLSTISLDRISDDDEVYHMFGALSAASKLQNVVLEIEVLASNVLQATQAYMEFLNISAEAV